MIVVKNVGTQIFGLGMTGGATPGLFDGGAEGGPGAENGGDSCLEGDVWINVAGGGVGSVDRCVDIHCCNRRIVVVVPVPLGRAWRKAFPRDYWRESSYVLLHV